MRQKDREAKKKKTKSIEIPDIKGVTEMLDKALQEHKEPEEEEVCSYCGDPACWQDARIKKSKY